MHGTCGPKLAAKTIKIKVRYTDFTTLTSQTSGEDRVESAALILELSRVRSCAEIGLWAAFSR